MSPEFGTIRVHVNPYTNCVYSTTSPRWAYRRFRAFPEHEPPAYQVPVFYLLHEGSVRWAPER